mmetsp:Transcript_37742/g.112092  ORF Transcript_37742/g.112092 Transcript_37742/m.112092 type:complete len:225 (+) Transcript_37742:22-696(+)
MRISLTSGSAGRRRLSRHMSFMVYSCECTLDPSSISQSSGFIGGGLVPPRKELSAGMLSCMPTSPPAKAFTGCALNSGLGPPMGPKAPRPGPLGLVLFGGVYGKTMGSVRTPLLRSCARWMIRPRHTRKRLETSSARNTNASFRLGNSTTMMYSDLDPTSMVYALVTSGRGNSTAQPLFWSCLSTDMSSTSWQCTSKYSLFDASWVKYMPLVISKAKSWYILLR